MEPSDRIAILDAIDAALGGEEAVVVATVTAPGDRLALQAGAKLALLGNGGVIGSLGDPTADEAARSEAASMFNAMPRVSVQTLYLSAEGRAATRRHAAGPGDAQVMLQLFEPPSRMIVVGAGHVGLAIAELAERLGFSVTVVDDRQEFANRERFPMADHVICGEVDQELRALPIDQSCHLVLVSRGHRQDELALREVVARGASYVGMIGSRRRTVTVLEHLLGEGYPREELERVATPIGLDIGAETPEEIAVSILAEITMLRRGGTGRRMSERRAPLRAARGAERP